ncbi:hypothetical protein BcDW1_10722 [Botrytis cinerea BcDW1]|uniref:Uncharacterized protein n=1 Tax=Botryotinia fuckeliana (strain BcDW1) TaxID=1290391 RepID=M7UBC8_BOTF1|nr:hypothetical protein BcDW1_10722 [Botrytis cinerea BcDW1]
MRFRIQIVITYLDNGLDCLPQRSCRVRKEKFKIIDREFRKSGYVDLRDFKPTNDNRQPTTKDLNNSPIQIRKNGQEARVQRT